MKIAAFSGGKDSALMVLRERPKYLLFTRTGNELPGVLEFIHRIADDIGAKLIQPVGPTLGELIYHMRAVPSWRMRWCTRLIKIWPVLKWAESNPDVTMLVGLRADEEKRKGILTDMLTEEFPLQRDGLTEADVWDGLREEGYADMIPERTDCAVCPMQGIHEWWSLCMNHPKEYEQGISWERYAGHTLRSPNRDTWPAGLRQLRKAFEKRGEPKQYKKRRGSGACRVCTL